MYNDKIYKLYDILMSKDIIESINNNLDELVSLIPEIKYMFKFSHKHPHHHLDVWEHTLFALSLSSIDFDIRLSLLLHDIGKPFSVIEINGVRHFPNHPTISKKMSKTILTRLGFSEDYINKICYLVEYHDTMITKDDIENDYDLSFKRYLIQECDALAHNPNKLEKRKKYLDYTKKLLKK